MRKFAFLALIQMVWMLSAPLASASDVMALGICNFGYYSMATSEIDASTLDDKALATKVKEKKTAFQTAYDTTYGGSFVPDPDDSTKSIPNDEYCGSENGSTHFIEKGDCSSQVITEIGEVVTSATPTVEGEDGETTGDKVVNLYHGICCLQYSKTDNNCYETRTYYTDTLDKCKAAAAGQGSSATVIEGTPNCELRQWIIAETGMGLLKLYVKQIFMFGSFAVGAIALANIILNGVRISVAGVSGDISDAKQKITQALSGIVLLFMSALILYSINPDFFG